MTTAEAKPIVVETATTMIRTLDPIIIPKTQALLDRIGDDLSDAAELEIDSPNMAKIGQELAGRISTVHAAMDEERLALGRPLREAQTWANDGYRPALDKLDEVLRSLKGKLLKFDREQNERNRKLAQQAEADAKERQKIADQQAAEARGRATELIEEAAIARRLGDNEEADRLMQEAQHLDSSATEVVETAAMAATIPAGTGIVKTSGVKGSTKKWKGRMIDKQRALLVAANTPDKQNFFDLNEANLNAYAQLTKGQVPVPGFEFYEEDGLRVAKRPV